MHAMESQHPSRPDAPAVRPMLRAVLVCDIVESTALVERLGDVRAAGFLQKHDQLLLQAMKLCHGQLVDKADGVLALFERPIQALAPHGAVPRFHSVGQPGVGAVTATLLNADGSVQDNQRALVTPWSLFRRRVLQRPELQIDWYSAAFLLLPSAAFRAVGGFDERYHMYCEDVDLCLRLQLASASLPAAG